MSPATLRAEWAKENFHKLRALRQQASAISSGTVPALRAVVRDAAEALRSRLERERNNDLSESVIVLDDDAAQRALMTWTLSNHLGVPVYGASSVAEARSLWYEHLSAVVVADLFLGTGEMGDQFIRSLDHGVRSILVSGVADKLTLETAAARCNAIPMRKPVDGIVEIVRGLLHVVHPPLWCRASADHILSVSTALAHLLGYTPQEMVDLGWRHFVHPDDLRAGDAGRALRQEHGTDDYVQRMRKKDGGYVAISWDVAPMTDGVLYAVGHVV